MSTTYLSDWRDKRIATLERELEVVRAQRDEHARWRSDLADKLHVAEAQLAERTKEMDEARTYCAGLASYICEPIYDDVANRCGVQADAQAAAGGAAVERWANADKQRLRAESAERQVEKMLDRLFERGEMALAPCFACGYNGPNYFQPDVHPCAARHHAALAPAQQEGGK